MGNPVAEAIRVVGGPTQASFVCRVSVNTIHTWRRDRVVRDTRAAVKLSEASGIPVKALAGLEDCEGNGDGPAKGPRFQEGGQMTSSTYHAEESGPSSDPSSPALAA